MSCDQQRKKGKHGKYERNNSKITTKQQQPSPSIPS
jgi:hypothetical protein